MSFDFNVLSSDDEDGNVGGERNFLGGILRESSNAATKPAVNRNHSDDHSVVDDQNVGNDGFDFDGYDDYCDLKYVSGCFVSRPLAS